MQKPTDYICLSYIPLLLGDHNTLNERKLPDNILEKVRDGEKLGMAESCLWCRYKGQIAPVFVLERSKEIKEHLVTWSEQKPGEWFKLYFVKKQDRYGVVLMPILSKSISRFKLAQLHLNETIITDKDKIILYFRPLQFLSKNRGMLDKVQLLDSHYLGLIDTKDLNLADLRSSPEPDFIGPFEVGDPEEYKWFFENLMK